PLLLRHMPERGILSTACPFLDHHQSINPGVTAMSRSLPIDAMATKSYLRQMICAITLTLLGVTTIAAQQSAVSRQKSPRLTTDDVARPPVVEQPAETKPALKTDEAGKTVAAETKPGEAKPGGPKTDPEEASWREQVGKARTKAKGLERAAEEAELRITTLRNQLGVSGESARHRNDTAAELEQAGQQVIVVRGQARVAADDLAQLVE